MLIGCSFCAPAGLSTLIGCSGFASITGTGIGGCVCGLQGTGAGTDDSGSDDVSVGIESVPSMLDSDAGLGVARCVSSAATRTTAAGGNTGSFCSASSFCSGWADVRASDVQGSPVTSASPGMVESKLWKRYQYCMIYMHVRRHKRICTML